MGREGPSLGELEVENGNIQPALRRDPRVKLAQRAGGGVAGIGKAGVPNLDSSLVQVWLGDVQICLDGGANPDYTEAAGAAVMAEKEITIRIDLARGTSQDKVYTCDFSYDYVKINADYRS